jgi:hypothetical protein
MQVTLAGVAINQAHEAICLKGFGATQGRNWRRSFLTAPNWAAYWVHPPSRRTGA